MYSVILYTIFALIGVLVLCMVINIILTAKKGAANRWVTRILYLSGIACVALNIARVYMLYESESTMLIITCVIALACILISFYRSEHPVKKDES